MCEICEEFDKHIETVKKAAEQLPAMKAALEEAASFLKERMDAYVDGVVEAGDH